MSKFPIYDGVTSRRVPDPGSTAPLTSEHLAPDVAMAAESRADVVRRSTKTSSMTWKDHLVMLLHIGAEIEHSLMVQYLYAAYSLGGDQVPVERRDMVRGWQNHIIAVAKEEMGHLLTVQNVLTLIGAPINLNRVDLPWDVPFYPFPFRLERLTLDSVACYVYAEMPSDEELGAAIARGDFDPKLLERYKRFRKTDRDRIEKQVRSRTRDSNPHRVGDLYAELMKLVANEDRIPDSVFQERTFPLQASFDDWGRGYRPDPQLVSADGSLAAPREASGLSEPANVLIDRMATRTEVLAALKALSEQGEAPVMKSSGDGELSHFDRFLEIYQQYADVGEEGWSPSRKVATNPSTFDRPMGHQGYISEVHSRDWAELFNLRYRMLLKYLAHSFRLARSQHGSTPNLRSMVMHRVFGEMYNLKSIAGILMRLPQHFESKVGPDTPRAGPPFEMPYVLQLPDTEHDAWTMHRDLLASAQRLTQHLIKGKNTVGHDYLRALFNIDTDTRAWANSILAGLGATEGPVP
jgi:hypothetical protein